MNGIDELIIHHKSKIEEFKAKVTYPVVDNDGENTFNHSRQMAHSTVLSALERHKRGDFNRAKLLEILQNVSRFDNPTQCEQIATKIYQEARNKLIEL